MRSARSDRVGTVTAVNWDGTINVSWGADLVSTSLPTVTSYTERRLGDRVLVSRRGLQWIVEGPAGTAAGLPVLASDPPPAGQGWIAVSDTESVRPDPMTGSLERWVVVPVVPPGAGTPAVPEVTEVSPLQYGWYEDGIAEGYAWMEQGDPQFPFGEERAGVAVFASNAWAFLAGKTIQSVLLTAHRRSTRHGPSGRAPAMFWLHNQLLLPTTVSDATFTVPGPSVSLQRNETSHPVALPPTWGSKLQAGTAKGVGIKNPFPHVQIDKVTITVAYY